MDCIGLAEWSVERLKKQGVHWSKWGHLGLGGDQGTDNTSGFQALRLYKPLKLVVTIVYDGAHGANRDIWGAYNDEHLKPFTQLMMIAINCNHGPDESDLRFHQCKDIMPHHFATYRPSQVPFFQVKMRRLLDELGEVIQRKENKSTQDAVWRTLRDAALFQKNGV